jgi:hypothetical protein
VARKVGTSGGRTVVGTGVLMDCRVLGYEQGQVVPRNAALTRTESHAGKALDQFGNIEALVDGLFDGFDGGIFVEADEALAPLDRGGDQLAAPLRCRAGPIRPVLATVTASSHVRTGGGRRLEAGQTAGRLDGTGIVDAGDATGGNIFSGSSVGRK